MREIPVGRSGLIALVDDLDYELVTRYPWGIKRGRRDTVYAYRQWWDENRGHHGQFMHCLIMGVVGVDHIDHDGLNNLRSNLRVASAAQNAQNRQKIKGATSRFKGVTWSSPHQRWFVSLKVNRRQKYLGLFDDEIEAAKVYDVAALEHFGEFAATNASLGLLS